MGSIFKYISDSALSLLEDKGGICQHCYKKDRPVYSFYGKIANPELSADGERAIANSEVYYACADCIKSNNLLPDEFKEKELKRAVPDNLWPVIESPEFRQKPEVMFLQHQNWPYCCNEMTEYIGDTPEDSEHYAEYQCWEPMSPSVSNFELIDFYPLTELEVLHSMCLFKCNRCSKKFWNFQYSGFLWPGPC